MYTRSFSETRVEEAPKSQSTRVRIQRSRVQSKATAFEVQEPIENASAAAVTEKAFPKKAEEAACAKKEIFENLTDVSEEIFREEKEEEVTKILPVVTSALPNDKECVNEEAVSNGTKNEEYADRGEEIKDTPAIYKLEKAEDPDLFLEELLTEGDEKDLLFMILVFLLKEELSVDNELTFIFILLLLAN